MKRILPTHRPRQYKEAMIMRFLFPVVVIGGISLSVWRLLKLTAILIREKWEDWLDDCIGRLESGDKFSIRSKDLSDNRKAELELHQMRKQCIKEK